MKPLLLLLFSFLSASALFAQGDFSGVSNSTANSPEITQRINVNADSRLEQMLEWHIEKNENQEGMNGYRVEIFFSSAINAKDQALKIKTEFLKLHPSYPVHIKFASPNFRVRIGDFRTKSEALKLYKQIQDNYPAAFIVTDIIDFPLLKTNKI
jgi:hypothetical protein